MRRLMMLLALLPCAARAQSPLALSVEVSGRETPLYPARDGSGRLYLEARAGATYAVRLRNTSGERLAVALDVDGANVIDGRIPASTQERMYVLDPYGTTFIQGWRSSLSEVHLFTFVDEAQSYASRTGQANGHLGWIEAKVYRERRPVWRGKVQEAPAPPAAPAPAQDEKAAQDSVAPAVPPGTAGAPTRSYPGTGWGAATDDRVVEVAFDPEPYPCQRLTLRYEYRGALLALGVLPRPVRDRLLERERGDFAQAPPY
jgi:hypothetical protein